MVKNSCVRITCRYTCTSQWKFFNKSFPFSCPFYTKNKICFEPNVNVFNEAVSIWNKPHNSVRIRLRTVDKKERYIQLQQRTTSLRQYFENLLVPIPFPAKRKYIHSDLGVPSDQPLTAPRTPASILLSRFV